jgi:hypothetical protein
VQRNSYSERGDGDIRATPSGVAASLAEGIIHGTNVLRARLKEQQFQSRDPKRFESDACIVECVLFEWFLRDLVISAEFGRHRNAISKALAGRLRTDLERSGLSPACLMDFDRLHGRRFAEYWEAFEATSSLQELGAVAWLKIGGSDEPSDRMTMLLAVRATAKVRALQGLGRRYTVIGPVRARLRPPYESERDAQRER